MLPRVVPVTNPVEADRMTLSAPAAVSKESLSSLATSAHSRAEPLPSLKNKHLRRQSGRERGQRCFSTGADPLQSVRIQSVAERERKLSCGGNLSRATCCANSRPG